MYLWPASVVGRGSIMFKAILSNGYPGQLLMRSVCLAGVGLSSKNISRTDGTNSLQRVEGHTDRIALGLA